MLIGCTVIVTVESRIDDAVQNRPADDLCKPFVNAVRKIDTAWLNANQCCILKGPVIFNQLVTKPVKGKQESFAVEDNARLQSSIWFMHADIAAKIIAGSDLLSKVLKLSIRIHFLNISSVSDDRARLTMQRRKR